MNETDAPCLPTEGAQRRGRHTESTVRPWPARVGWGARWLDLAAHVATGNAWLRALPGKTMSAIHWGMLQADMGQDHRVTGLSIRRISHPLHHSER